MNPLLAEPTEFAALLQRFFAERMLQQQAASPRTIAAYRDAFRLVLAYAERKLGKPPAKLTLSDFDAELILGFLAHVEAERHNTVRTRNARLAAIRAFARYVAAQCPPALLLVQQILAIPMKRFDKPLLGTRHHAIGAPARQGAETANRTTLEGYCRRNSPLDRIHGPARGSTATA